MKFRFQKIDLESKTTYTCHAAEPHHVDFNWLADNPGQLHNTSINVAERDMMLANIRNSSCEQNCWAAEDAGAHSPRMYQGGTEKTHTDLTLTPEIIDITVGSDCNLTCTYCCKEFSSAWRRDIVINGDYTLSAAHDDRFTANAKDKVLLKLSQPGRKATQQYQALMNEVLATAPTAKKIIITGGEPFLDNALLDTITKLSLADDAVIELYSGFGVSISRFEKIVEQLQPVKNLYINISAETTGKLFEFNRYGNTWQDFATKIKILDRYGIEYRFHSVISNLTIAGFADFYRMYNHKIFEVTFAYQPSMMAPYVLDNESKERIIENIKLFPANIKGPIMESIRAEPTELQRQNIKEFLVEFTRRRDDLSLSIYPASFLTWAGINVV